MNEYSVTLAKSKELGVSHLLEKWQQPPVKPNPLILSENNKLNMTGFVTNTYFTKIALGCEITLENWNDDIGRIIIYSHEFKPTDTQLAALKKDNFAYIFDVRGFTYIYSKSEFDKSEEYKQDVIKYREFENNINETQRLIKNKIDYLNAVDQHKELVLLPFSYYVAIKVNVRMLTGNNWGNGAKKNTVTHLVLDEEYNGRIKRKQNTFLCGAGRSSYGQPRKEDDSLTLTSNIGTVKAKVSCAKCLELAYRILKNC